MTKTEMMNLIALQALEMFGVPVVVKMLPEGVWVNVLFEKVHNTFEAESTLVHHHFAVWMDAVFLLKYRIITFRTCKSGMYKTYFYFKNQIQESIWRHQSPEKYFA